MYKNGFSKIEILIIATIVGVLGLSAVFAVTTARSRTRDALRMSDVRQLQVGLELFFIDYNTYPETSEYLALGSATTRCLTSQGFVSGCTDDVYLEAIAATPNSGLSGLSSCSDIGNAYCYAAQDGEYRIQFELEHQNPLIGLVEGANCATQNGLEPGECKALQISVSE